MVLKTLNGAVMLTSLFLGVVPSFAKSLGTQSLKLYVKESSGINRGSDVIQNGIPLSQDLAFTDPQKLCVLDAGGVPVPAQFEVLSRWSGGLTDVTKPIQWLMVSFPASVASGGSKDFTLTVGVNPASKSPLKIIDGATDISVATGKARFVISKTEFSVLKSAYQVDSAGLETQVIGKGGGKAEIEVKETGVISAMAPDVVTIERQGQMWSTVKVVGHFNLPVKGGKKLLYTARYNFYAGEPYVHLDFSYSWPSNTDGAVGNHVDDLAIGYTDQQSKMLMINRVHLSVPLVIGDTVTSFLGADSRPGVTAKLASGQKTSVTQERRALMTDNPKFTTLLAGNPSATGGFASQPFVASIGAKAGIGATIQQMRYYEPQTLTSGSDSLGIDIVSAPQWLASFMGGFAKIAISVVPGIKDAENSRSQVLGALDWPLVAWPSAADVSHSMALGELWDGNATALSSQYLDHLHNLSQNTIDGYERFGMYGFMTYGFTVREMKSYYQEFGDKSTWDSYFNQGYFTDYHNTLSNSFLLFAMTNEPKWIMRISYPGARRMLHTMIAQIDSGVGFFGGLSSTGYGAYRTDANSSHQYFENLYLYYYLTGDRQVLETVRYGGENIRNCYSRAANNSIIPGDQPARSDWMGSVGRVPSQYADIEFFLAHASNDYTFLQDFRNFLDRMASRNLVMAKSGTKEYAFISGTDQVATPGVITTDQAWMLGIYTLNDLWKLYSEYGDVKIGKDSISISRILRGACNGIWDYNAKLYPLTGNGTATGDWANSVTVAYTGSRSNGTITLVSPALGSDDKLFPSSKSPLIAFTLRTASLSDSDKTFNARAAELYSYVFGSFTSKDRYWDKEISEYFTRLHPAIYYMNAFSALAVKSVVEAGPLFSKATFTDNRDGLKKLVEWQSTKQGTLTFQTSWPGGGNRVSYPIGPTPGKQFLFLDVPGKNKHWKLQVWSGDPSVPSKSGATPVLDGSQLLFDSTFSRSNTLPYTLPANGTGNAVRILNIPDNSHLIFSQLSGRTLLDKKFDTAPAEFIWAGKSNASGGTTPGFYLYRIESEGQSITSGKLRIVN